MMKYFKKLHGLSEKIHPNSTRINYFRKNLRFVMWGLLNPRVIKELIALQDNENLTAVFEKNYKIFEKPLKPFISPVFSSSQRLQLISSHFDILESKLSANVINLYEQPFEITTFLDRTGRKYKIEFFPGESREGSIGIRLVEFDSGYSIYSITCNLSEQCGERVLHIGCLQGSNRRVVDSQTKIKEITRTLHGLRPKALMLELSLSFARYFNVKKVIAVSNKGHVYKAYRYLGSKRGVIRSDYDSLWEEIGGRKINNNFYQIPIDLERKNLVDLKKSKRSLYSKRYLLLENLDKELVSSLSRVV
ncbi:VirK/YbjX family protein [Vibrio splendidus]